MPAALAFKVKHNTFEGPLEVLLELIEKRKLLINEISLASVASDFVEHVRNQKEFPMGDSAQFILIASTLLLIKSRSLLPELPLTDAEESNIEDLEERLTLYRECKELALHIDTLQKTKYRSYFKRGKTKMIVFSPTAEITISNIREAGERLIMLLPTEKILPKVKVEKTISLEEMMADLSERIKKELRLSFKTFRNEKSASKTDVIVGFLAILELLKRGAISANQDSYGSDISIESGEVGTPRYG